MKQHLKSIYRNPEGEAEIHSIYDRQLSKLNLPYESRMVQTSFGETHVLVLGPQDAPPVVILHGGNTTSPLTLGWIRPLIERYCVYAPDTIGHPGKSAPVRISPRDDSYGRWVVEVLDALDLGQPSFLGGSYGAGILLRAAVCAPERIAKAILFIPSGLVSIPVRTLFSMLWWMGLYRLSPSTEQLKRILRPMILDEPYDMELLKTTEAVFRLMNIEPEMPRNVRPSELVNFKAPTLIIAAEKDGLFPGEAVVRRAKKVFPNLVCAEVILGATHYLSPRYHAYLNERIEHFLLHTA
jgi:pimeloyl-ACP methyl ester carboxylesterase